MSRKKKMITIQRRTNGGPWGTINALKQANGTMLIDELRDEARRQVALWQTHNRAEYDYRICEE